MTLTELCGWLRANSSGIYRPAAEAAEEIEHLAAAKDRWKEIADQAQRKASAAKERRDGALGALKNLDARLRECMALGLSAAEAYDSFYQAETHDALSGWVLGDA